MCRAEWFKFCHTILWLLAAKICQSRQSSLNRGFHKMYNIGNNGNSVINANFVLLYICSFLLDLHQMGFTNVKFNINGFWSYVFWSCYLHWSGSFLMTEPKQNWHYCHSGIVESLWKPRIAHWVHERILTSIFHWLALKKRYGKTVSQIVMLKLILSDTKITNNICRIKQTMVVL